MLSKKTLSGLLRVTLDDCLPVENLLSQISSPTSPYDTVLQKSFPKIFFTYRNPSSSDMNAMDIMLDANRRGVLQLKSEFITTSPDIPATPLEQEYRRGRTIESEEHKCMKHWVCKYLNFSNTSSACEEISIFGYKVDAGCFDEKVFIECGDTEPTKVLGFLRKGYSIGILQYDSEDIVWFIPTEKFIKEVQLRNFL